MRYRRRPWTEELAIIDRVMKSVSDITDPNDMVRTYWDGIGDLVPGDHYLALSRRGVEPPEFLITRSSRFTEHYNPWTQRDRLPRLSGGLLGEIAYADKPVVIDDLPARLAPDDPGRFYLEGYQSLIALPQYEGGKGVNIGMTLFEPGDEFDHSILPMMHWQASLFGRGTQNLVLRNQLQKALADLDRELEVVGEIQRSLLPRELPRIDGFEVAAFYRTSARAGGDYYDFFPLDADGWGVFIADVSGHGTPAAVLMAITHAIAHTRPGRLRPPGDVMAHLNMHLARTYTTAGTFVTAFYATLDPVNRHLTYASAGHNPPRLRRAGRVIALDETAGLPLGIVEEEAFGEAGIALEPGDLLLLYTDGITEVMAPPDAEGSRELYGEERLDALLLTPEARTAQGCVATIREAVTAFARGTPPTDDQTLIAIRCVGPQG
jgi:sigma-B regulation protein RsbU (phosphoserine phosphatase)